MRSDQRLTRGCRTRLQHSLCTTRSEQCWPTPRTHSHRHYRRAEGARWTLFRLDDSAGFVHGVSAVYLCALVSLLLGRHTSCAAGVAFVCCVSQQVCAPGERSGMYSVAAHALFWAALMPMQRASRDASSDGVAEYLHAVSALGLRTQLLCMYLGAAAAKRRSTAWTRVLDPPPNQP